MAEKEMEALRKKLIRKAKEKVREHYAGAETHIIRAVSLLADLDSIFNLMSEHAREWYSVHFPELEGVVKDNEAFLKLVFSLGERQNFTKKNVLEHYGNEENAARVAEAASKSMGSEIGKAELAELKVLCLNALNLREEKLYLQKYIEDAMAKTMPNFTALCGGILAAKILAKAGSVKKLAMMPSSTIQLIGAEKAFFQFLKSGSKNPKYGFIFQHPAVAGAARWNRGKAARCLAGKLCIAAREDYFSDRDISAALRAGLEKRLREIEARKPKPKAWAGTKGKAVKWRK